MFSAIFILSPPKARSIGTIGDSKENNFGNSNEDSIQAYVEYIALYHPFYLQLIQTISESSLSFHSVIHSYAFKDSSW